jgi:lauroyl/myristoyl acyltransferase
MFLFKNSNFSKNLDLLLWVQRNLLPSKIKESMCEREGELKIKFEKERVRAIGRNLEYLNYKKELERERKSKEEGEEWDMAAVISNQS